MLKSRNGFNTVLTKPNVMYFLNSADYKGGSLTTMLADTIEDLLLNTGVPALWVVYVKLIVYILIAIVVIMLLQFTVRAILSFVIKKAHSTTGKNILDYAVDNRLPHYLALLAPYTFIRTFIPVMFSSFPGFISPATKMADIYLVLLVIWAIIAVVKSFFNVLQERPAFEHRPMRSYVQVVSIILYGVGVIVTFAIITEQSPGVILAGLGAASAVTMLVFQDSIKGFVGSIQMTTNNMLGLHDWIIMDKNKADGIVEEINLTTVKVRNWDNTVTTIPTYSLISDSFQNWKAMQKTGGRRINRPLMMKQGSIRFLTEEELARYKTMPFLSDVITDRLDKNKNIDKNLTKGTVPITNNDLFMAYTEHYLKNHPDINKDMIITCRQAAPTPEGLPVEVYAFSTDVTLVGHHKIASEIMNHLIGMVGFFDLKLFEMLSDTAENP